jgi:hypothetical protein
MTKLFIEPHQNFRPDVFAQSRKSMGYTPGVNTPITPVGLDVLTPVVGWKGLGVDGWRRVVVSRLKSRKTIYLMFSDDDINR